MMTRQDGFTIVEALAAMAILSVTIIVLYGVGADTLQASTRIGEVDRALLFAQSKLDSLDLVTAPLPANEDGTTDGYRWTVTARAIPSQSISSRDVLQNVELVIAWKNGLRSHSLALSSRHFGRTAL